LTVRRKSTLHNNEQIKGNGMFLNPRLKNVVAMTMLLALLFVSLQQTSAQRSQENDMDETVHSSSAAIIRATEQRITNAPHGHLLTNTGVWSYDGRWIVYDIRSDPAGSNFDGTRIERVNVETGEVETLYESQNESCCGVVTTSPTDDRVVFIHGPENPTPDWQYAAHHRRGSILHADQPDVPVTLDARDLTPPFTPGALRGGTHVHTFSPDGEWIAFTYEDHVLATYDSRVRRDGLPLNQRNVGVSVPHGPVTVGRLHPRTFDADAAINGCAGIQDRTTSKSRVGIKQHDGSHFSVLVTRTTEQPTPGSDDITRAFSDAWVGTSGYVRPDGTRQERAIAFQGNVVTEEGTSISEVFIVDLPNDLTTVGAEPLEGTATTRPAPPKGVVQRRLTYTADGKHPGIQGPRHWLRSSPDGSRIAFLMKDDEGVVQLFTVSPNGGPSRQITHNEHDIDSAFTWSPDGCWIAHLMDGSVCVTNAESGVTHRLTPQCNSTNAPRPEACVFSPDGDQIAYVRPTANGNTWNQIYVVTLEGIAP